MKIVTYVITLYIYIYMTVNNLIPPFQSIYNTTWGRKVRPGIENETFLLADSQIFFINEVVFESNI